MKSRNYVVMRYEKQNEFIALMSWEIVLFVFSTRQSPFIHTRNCKNVKIFISNQNMPS